MSSRLMNGFMFGLAAWLFVNASTAYVNLGNNDPRLLLHGMGIAVAGAVFYFTTIDGGVAE